VERPVLVNRRRDGPRKSLRISFFTAGHGSTLEMRLFTDESLRDCSARNWIQGCEFLRRKPTRIRYRSRRAVFAPDGRAQRANFERRPGSWIEKYLEAFRQAGRSIRELETLTGDYQRYIAYPLRIRRAVGKRSCRTGGLGSEDGSGIRTARNSHR